MTMSDKPAQSELGLALAAVEQKPKRIPGRPFQPGESGNPNGRPKGYLESRLKCRALDPITLAVLEELLSDEDPDIRFKAACRIRDEAFGKPVQAMKVAKEDEDALRNAPDSELFAVVMAHFNPQGKD